MNRANGVGKASRRRAGQRAASRIRAETLYDNLGEVFQSVLDGEN
jgi:hypothetical protein